MTEGLSILGTGAYLPPIHSAAELARAAGGDVSNYFGWPTIPVAGPDDHPSTMCANAVRTALERAGLEAKDLSLVIAGGMSRDYLPSWSTAAEIMKVCGATDACLPLDITDGCMGGMVAFDLARGWLAGRGGGHAAIVCAERWTQTVDRANQITEPMWGIGDGAAATIVGIGSSRPSFGRFVGAEYCSQSELNGRVLIKYGGTRFPAPPEGVDGNIRTLAGEKYDVRATYVRCYGAAISRARERFGIKPERLICNQITARLTEDLAGLAGVPWERTVRTGAKIGHIGSADLQLGLNELVETTGVDAPVEVLASTPYVFGAGFIVPE